MATVLDGAGRFVQNPGVVSRKIAGETLAVPIRGGVGDLDSIFSFNPMGSEIWELLKSESSLEEITSWVFDNFDVSREQARQDVSAFVDELLQAGLLIPAEEPVCALTA